VTALFTCFPAAALGAAVKWDPWFSPKGIAMRMDATEDRGEELPIRLTVAGTPIGGACTVEEEVEGTLRFEGLDVMARVFFAERVGPGGPGDDITVRDLCVLDHNQHRSMKAEEARIRHFSAGSGDLELAATFFVRTP
jgi:hypothetical protein